MKTLLYANRAEPKSISVISILLLAAAGDITKLRCMHRECYIFASKIFDNNITLLIKLIMLVNILYVICFYVLYIICFFYTYLISKINYIMAISTNLVCHNIVYFRHKICIKETLIKYETTFSMVVLTYKKQKSIPSSIFFQPTSVNEILEIIANSKNSFTQDF